MELSFLSEIKWLTILTKNAQSLNLNLSKKQIQNQKDCSFIEELAAHVCLYFVF